MTCRFLDLVDVKFDSGHKKKKKHAAGKCLFCSLLEVPVNSLVSSFVDVLVCVVNVIITFGEGKLARVVYKWKI